MKIVCIADTHGDECYANLPEGDILIHAGDYDIRDLRELERINRWWGRQNFKHKVTIAGNHDLYLEKLNKHMTKEIFTNVQYLQEDMIEIEGVKIWGAPYTPIFFSWAFMKSGDELKRIWSKIPESVDVVVTHGPPLGILDYVEIGKRNIGCPHLRDRIKEIKPIYHICGHIHGSYGVYQDECTTYINASLMDEGYNLNQEPIVVEI